MSDRNLTKVEINSLFPIRNLSDSKKQKLERSYKAEEIQAKTVLFSSNDNDARQLYLLEGKVKLIQNNQTERIIEGGNIEARFPLDGNNPRQTTAIALGPIIVFSIEKSTLEALINDTAPTRTSENIAVTETDNESLLYNQLYFEVSQEMQANRLEIPSIPDTAQKVRRAVSDPNISIEQITKIVQVDPAISAQLIKIANSPLFRGREKIESLPSAITRLGLKVISNLITSFTMRMVFNAKTKDVKMLMSQLWLHSRDVACISAVIAKKLKGFDTDKAMLAGLMHDIGAIPVLTHADKHPNLLENPQEVSHALEKLTPLIGKSILERWNFTHDFSELAIHAEQWHRETNEPADYTDLIIVAQLLSFENTLLKDQYPDATTVPAYNRLEKLLKNPEDSIHVIRTAQDELSDIQQLFN